MYRNLYVIMNVIHFNNCVGCMKTIGYLLILFQMLGLMSCKSSLFTRNDSAQNLSGINYIPINPVPCISSVKTDSKPNCQLLAALPSETVFLSILDITASGNIAVAPVVTSKAGSRTYEVILDYIKYGSRLVDISKKLDDTSKILNSREVSVLPGETVQSTSVKIIIDTTSIVYYAKYIPVYYGVGVRLRARVTTKSADVNITSLSGIQAGVEAKKLTGTLTVQTLGLSGRAISSVIPLPSELNQTTIQNALMAMATIKGLMYDKEVVITPSALGYLRPNIIDKNVNSDYYTYINIILLQHLIDDPINIVNDVNNAPDCSK